MYRWKDRLATIKPRSLTATRAQSFTQETVNKYNEDLESIHNKYHLQDTPQLIYHVDETGLQPKYRPPSIIACKSSKPQAVTSPRSTIVILIACANAAGSALPPYFVFKGKRMNDELLKGALPGTGFSLTVQMVKQNCV